MWLKNKKSKRVFKVSNCQVASWYWFSAGPWFCWWYIYLGHSVREDLPILIHRVSQGYKKRFSFAFHSLITYILGLKQKIVNAKYKNKQCSLRWSNMDEKNVNTKWEKCQLEGFHRTINSLSTYWKYLGLSVKLLNIHFLNKREKGWLYSCFHNHLNFSLFWIMLFRSKLKTASILIITAND